MFFGKPLGASRPASARLPRQSDSSFKVSENPQHSMYKGVHYLFSSEANKKSFDADPEKYSNKLLSKAG